MNAVLLQRRWGHSTHRYVQLADCCSVAELLFSDLGERCVFCMSPVVEEYHCSLSSCHNIFFTGSRISEDISDLLKSSVVMQLEDWIFVSDENAKSGVASGKGMEEKDALDHVFSHSFYQLLDVTLGSSSEFCFRIYTSSKPTGVNVFLRHDGLGTQQVSVIPNQNSWHVCCFLYGCDRQQVISIVLCVEDVIIILLF